MLAGAVFPSPAAPVFVERIVRRMLRLNGVHNYSPADLARALEFLSREREVPIRTTGRRRFLTRRNQSRYRARPAVQAASRRHHPLMSPLTLPGVRAVIFDISGTVLDFGSRGPACAFVELFSRHGVPITEQEARRPMGAHKRDHIEALLSDPGIAARWR